jgi:ribosomal protein S18 acetylase RimI-like enzyme
LNPEPQTAKLEPQTVSIRVWELADLPSIQHIAWTTWLASYGSFIPEEDMRAFFDEYYTTEVLSRFCHAELARGFLAECDSTSVGFAKTNLNTDDNKFYLNSLYILPEYQSKGIGSRLLRACEDFALSLNADEVWLGVMTQNVSALEWYKKIGFQFVREEPFTMGKTTVMHLIGNRIIKH